MFRRSVTCAWSSHPGERSPGTFVAWGGVCMGPAMRRSSGSASRPPFWRRQGVRRGRAHTVGCGRPTRGILGSYTQMALPVARPAPTWVGLPELAKAILTKAMGKLGGGVAAGGALAVFYASNAGHRGRASGLTIEADL